MVAPMLLPRKEKIKITLTPRNGNLEDGAFEGEAHSRLQPVRFHFSSTVFITFVYSICSLPIFDLHVRITGSSKARCQIRDLLFYVAQGD